MAGRTRQAHTAAKIPAFHHMSRASGAAGGTWPVDVFHVCFSRQREDNSWSGDVLKERRAFVRVDAQTDVRSQPVITRPQQLVCLCSLRHNTGVTLGAAGG